MNFTIPIPPRTKKNSSRIVFAKNRRIIIPSELYKKFENDSKPFIPSLDSPIDYPINLKCVYYMPSKRRVDLSNLISATSDILVKHKLILDDNRNIIAAYDGSRVLYDKNCPRTEITITKLEDYQQW